MHLPKWNEGTAHLAKTSAIGFGMVFCAGLAAGIYGIAAVTAVSGLFVGFMKKAKGFGPFEPSKESTQGVVKKCAWLAGAAVVGGAPGAIAWGATTALSRIVGSKAAEVVEKRNPGVFRGNRI